MGLEIDLLLRRERMAALPPFSEDEAKRLKPGELQLNNLTRCSLRCVLDVVGRKEWRRTTSDLRERLD